MALLDSAADKITAAISSGIAAAQAAGLELEDHEKQLLASTLAAALSDLQSIEAPLLPAINSLAASMASLAATAKLLENRIACAAAGYGMGPSAGLDGVKS